MNAFIIFRFHLGFYLFFHFAYLIPYSTELFSSEGMFPQCSVNLTAGFFPNLLAVADTPWMVTLSIVVLAFLSVLIGLGGWRRGCSILVWYGWACLYHRNNLIHNPSVPYIAWLLLACAIIPSGEGFLWPGSRWHKRTIRSGWNIPPSIRMGAWILLGLGYSLSGYDKLQNSPSWRNGEALRFILQTPFARDVVINNWILTLPTSILKIFSGVVVGMELAFGPLVLWKKTRPLAWAAMTLIQIGILVTIDFPDLTLGMLLVHLFVFDPKWLRPSSKI